MAMRVTKRRPVTVGGMLRLEFLEPTGIGINDLAKAMDVHRNTVSRLVNNKGALTAPMAVKLAAAFGTTAEVWLNIQHVVELWDIRNGTYKKETEGIQTLHFNREETSGVA